MNTTTQLDKTTNPWLFEPSLILLFAAVRAAGGEARVVGGAVRNALLGLPVQEIDLACTLTPDLTMKAAQKAGLKAIPTGIDHGTVTVLSSGKSYEVTTLRCDMETDGRRAKVAFISDWSCDATRRDFTINALYVDEAGFIYDEVGGVADLKARILRFIGSPVDRIAEDALRLLRYFRFISQLQCSVEVGGLDQSALEACRDAANQLNSLSKERKWQEFAKLLGTDKALSVLLLMDECAVLPVLLPLPYCLTGLARLIELEKSHNCVSALRRLSHMVWPAQESLCALFPFTRRQRQELEEVGFITQKLSPDLCEKEMVQIFYDFPSSSVLSSILLFAAREEEGAKLLPFLSLLETWEKPVFPLLGRDLMGKGHVGGQMMGWILRDTERWWRSQGFAPDKLQCLAYAQSIQIVEEEKP